MAVQCKKIELYGLTSWLSTKRWGYSRESLDDKTKSPFFPIAWGRVYKCMLQIEKIINQDTVREQY